jgi:hypothetical protein
MHTCGQTPEKKTPATHVSTIPTSPGTATASQPHPQQEAQPKQDAPAAQVTPPNPVSLIVSMLLSFVGSCMHKLIWNMAFNLLVCVHMML